MNSEQSGLSPEAMGIETEVYKETDLNSRGFDSRFEHFGLFNEGQGVFKKIGEVEAKIAEGGEKVVTVLADKTEETTNIAEKGDYIASNPKSGEHWIIKPDKFMKKYEEIEDNPGKYKPKGEPVKAIPVDQDIKFKAPWGEEQRITKGGYIIQTGDRERYGIGEEEFKSTYQKDELSTFAWEIEDYSYQKLTDILDYIGGRPSGGRADLILKEMQKKLEHKTKESIALADYPHPHS